MLNFRAGCHVSQKLTPINLIDIVHSQIARSSLLLGGSNLAGALFNFLISILIGRNLGQAGFGRWVFLLAWASGLTMICEFGMNSLLTKKVSNSANNLNQSLFLTLFVKSMFTLFWGGFLWIAAPYLGLDAEISTGLRFVVFIVLFGVWYGSFTAIFRGLGLMMPILVFNISSLFLQLLGTFWLLQYNTRVLPLIQWLTLINAFQLSLAFVFWLLRLARTGGKISFSVSCCLDTLKEATPFALAGIIGAIQMRSSVILLGYIKGESAIGSFGSAARFTEAAKLIPNGIFDAAFPAFARGDQSAASRMLLFRQLNQAIYIYCFLVALPLVFFSGSIIKWAFGLGFISASPVLVWLGISLFPTLNNAVVEVCLYAIGGEKFAARLGLIGVGVQILTGLPLMYFYGSAGAAAAIFLGEITIWLPLKLRLNRLL